MKLMKRLPLISFSLISLALILLIISIGIHGMIYYKVPKTGDTWESKKYGNFGSSCSGQGCGAFDSPSLCLWSELDNQVYRALIANAITSCISAALFLNSLIIFKREPYGSNILVLFSSFLLISGFGSFLNLWKKSFTYKWYNLQKNSDHATWSYGPNSWLEPLIFVFGIAAFVIRILDLFKNRKKVKRFDLDKDNDGNYREFDDK
ncbi:hypothetical protein M0811_00831 [Anaeramoeba ignava]|uniref:Uncharacterized protein n=1 Tax=Anaeramoeba ignava TaxID=1746090 RepID=A0A9Q0RBK2_ANAIG|nr:hypothetical protein M0811_00831 [Anaeramoeba ignava]